jgi:hypothetical protein
MPLEDLVALMPIGTFVVALAAFLVGLFNRRHIQAIHIDINSRLTQLLDATAAAARAEGVTVGEQSQRDRSSEPQP